MQPEEVQQQQHHHHHQEPQRHQLKKLERRPLGPTVGEVDAQEGDQQRHLQGERTTAALVHVLSMSQFTVCFLFFEKKVSDETHRNVYVALLGNSPQT